MKQKDMILGALASAISVLIALLAAVLTALNLSSLPNYSLILIVLALGALMAAFAATLVIVGLRRKPTIENRQIFLVYAHEDRKRVAEIYNALKDAGYKPWMDTMNLMPGQAWEDQVLKAIQQSELALVFLSKNAVEKKGFVQKEIKTALNYLEERNEGISPVIPVRLEETDVPLGRLRELHWIDVFTKADVQKLVKSLKSVKGLRRERQSA